VQPPVNAEQQPVMSLYDLFGFSEEERKQLNATGRNKKKPAPKQGKPVQPNLFSQPQTEAIKNGTNNTNSNSNPTNSVPVYPVFDARKEELEQQRQELEKPRPYSGILKEHHKQGSLVTEQNGQIGFLK
jgi:hypothetical protein